MNTDTPVSPWPVFFMVATGVFLSTMDSSMINVALPSIMRSFDATLAASEWVVQIYLLTITLTLLVFGRLADHYGKGSIYLLGMMVFTIGSFLCYGAMTLEILVFFRLIQALGAAMMMATGPAIIKTVFPVGKIGMGLGFIGIATSTGLMLGPVISGIVVHNYSWRGIFIVTVPVSLTVFVFGWFRLRSKIMHQERVDIMPLRKRYFLPLALFRKRFYVVGIICAALSFTVLFVVLILMPFYLDYILGLSPQETGFVMMSVPLAVFLVAPLSGIAYDRIGARFLTTAGLALTGISLFLFCLLTQNSTPLDVVWRLVLLGCGQALFLSPNSAVLLDGVEAGDSGITSGMLATARNLGMLLGVTLGGMVFAVLFGRLSGGFDLKQFQPAYAGHFMEALGVTFAFTAMIAAGGTALSWFRTSGKS